MTLKQVDREFQRIDVEIHKKLRVRVPYPPEVVSRRGLLILAQVQLGKIIEAKQTRHKKMELFYTELYRVTIEHYFNWKS